MADNLESAARMAMVPPYEESRRTAQSGARLGLAYALYAAVMAALLVGAAAIVSV
jgi:hypothetical protein